MLLVNQFRESNEDIEGGLFDKMIHLVSIVKNLDPFIVQEWDSTKLISSYKEYQPLLNVSERYKESVIIDSVELSLIDFKMLTLGQWIDIESMVSENYITNLHKIAATIYLENKGGKMYSDKWEEYKNININYRANLIDDLNASDVLGAVKKYLKFRDIIFDSYELFNDPYEGVDIEELNEEERSIYEEEKKTREKGAKNQSQKLLNILTNNDITKFNEVLSMNLFLALNQVTFLKSNNT